MISIKATDGAVTLSLSVGLKRFEAEKPRILREIGMSLLVSIRQGFEAECSPDGEAWEPLKPATVRQRKGNAHPILQRHGRLKKSITLSRGKHKGQVRLAKANDKRAKFGMASAAYNMHIPARPYLFQRDGDIPDDWKRAIVGIVKRHLGVDHA